MPATASIKRPIWQPRLKGEIQELRESTREEDRAAYEALRKVFTKG